MKTKIFDNFNDLKTFYHEQSKKMNWDTLGLFLDKELGEQHNFIIVLLKKEQITASFKLIFDSVDDFVSALRLFNRNEEIIYRFMQGKPIDKSQLSDYQYLNAVWKMCCAQEMRIKNADLPQTIKKALFSKPNEGRGKELNKEGKFGLHLYAHGRCMYEGCGQNLFIDELTGTEGNYAYMAHNVASAGDGPRGIAYGISEALSNQPENFLLLCDKHHRLIDRIALAEHDASRLTAMRESFGRLANSLLAGLSHEPVLPIGLNWPVQGMMISTPATIQIARSMSKLNWRPDGQIQMPANDNDEYLREECADSFTECWIKVIDRAVTKINGILSNNLYKAALFAFGPMPCLIALGANLGNKQEIIPMLRYRDGNIWQWPAETPLGKKYQIQGVEKLTSDEPEIFLSLNFTSKPKSFSEFAGNQSFKHVSIIADEPGNAAIAHPKDGIRFMSDIQQFLHKLKSEHKVKRVHVLPCMSNALCVFFGKAFDLHHPEMIIYDCWKNSLKPSLLIKNSANGVVLENSMQE